MRSKAPLMLMEQMIMILVFALAAALCMQAFVRSGDLSRQSEARDYAVAAAQSAADTVQHCRGDMAEAAARLGGRSQDEDSLMVDYAEDWTVAEDTMRYTLGVAKSDSGVPGLGRGEVWVRDEVSETELLRLEIAWQEVDGDGS